MAVCELKNVFLSLSLSAIVISFFLLFLALITYSSFFHSAAVWAHTAESADTTDSLDQSNCPKHWTRTDFNWCPLRAQRKCPRPKATCWMRNGTALCDINNVTWGFYVAGKVRLIFHVAPCNWMCSQSQFTGKIVTQPHNVMFSRQRHILAHRVHVTELQYVLVNMFSLAAFMVYAFLFWFIYLKDVSVLHMSTLMRTFLQHRGFMLLHILHRTALRTLALC